MYQFLAHGNDVSLGNGTNHLKNTNKGRDGLCIIPRVMLVVRVPFKLVIAGQTSPINLIVRPRKCTKHALWQLIRCSHQLSVWQAQCELQLTNSFKLYTCTSMRARQVRKSSSPLVRIQ
eukprot:scaffold469820_cov17-Prasinocladus_malaysianus.AAC.1